MIIKILDKKTGKLVEIKPKKTKRSLERYNRYFGKSREGDDKNDK